MLRRFPYLVAVAAACLLLVSCSDTSTRVNTTSADTDTPRIAAQPEWAAEGNRLRADKAANARKGGRNPDNAGDFAYQSSPIDITGPGDYPLTFGPVANLFDPPRSPAGLALNVPSDASFKYEMVNAPTVKVGSGGRFVTWTLRVISKDAAYPQFTMWIY